MTFEDLKFEPRHGIPGIRAEVQFANGYGASVIRGHGTYGGDQGLYELAVTQGDNLTYHTPITDDVLGFLSEADVTKTLADIEGLSA